MTEISPAHFRRHRFPAENIAHAVWLYYGFPLSFRNLEELLAERGIEVSSDRFGMGCEIRPEIRALASSTVPRSFC